MITTLLLFSIIQARKVASFCMASNYNAQYKLGLKDPHIHTMNHITLVEIWKWPVSGKYMKLCHWHTKNHAQQKNNNNYETFINQSNCKNRLIYNNIISKESSKRTNNKNLFLIPLFVSFFYNCFILIHMQAHILLFNCSRSQWL